MATSNNCTGLHILLYTDDPGVGGVAQYNHSLLCGLAKRGYRLTCVQSQSTNPLVITRSTLGVTHRWLSFDPISDYLQARNNQQEPQTIFSEVQPDLILFSDGCPLSSLAAKRAALALGIPFVVVVGYVAEEQAHYPPQTAALLRQINRHARDIVAVSNHNLALLHRHFYLPPHRGQVIHYGRPAHYFAVRNPQQRQRLRQEWKIPEAGVVCFTSARLEFVKGYQFQLAAIEQLRTLPIWEKLYFVWAGAGGLMETLQTVIREQGLSEHVKLLGQRWDIAECLDASDIFVLPSLNEGMPLAVMEAMAKQVPVIATAVSGIPEELGETGHLLPDPKLDPKATVQQLVAALADWSTHPCRHQLAEAALRRAATLFTEERMLHQTIALVERALVPEDDYVSPGLEMVFPDRAFPNMSVGNHNLCAWPHLRRDLPHNWYVDARHPGVGFLNRDEAHLLYNLALPFRGKRALEVGCWLGWSACHLGLAGVSLDVIDPVLAQPFFQQSVSASLNAARVLDNVTLIAGYSPASVEEHFQRTGRRWSLIFIDGDHEAPAPLRDTVVCEQYAEPDAMIIFHDLTSPDVAEGLHYLHCNGWQTLVYQTTQIMGVAWRGNIQPVVHQPDSTVNWPLPEHLRGYRVSGLEASQDNSEIRTALLHALVQANSDECTTALLAQCRDQPGELISLIIQSATGGDAQRLLRVVQHCCNYFDFGLAGQVLEEAYRQVPQLREHLDFMEAYNCFAVLTELSECG